MSDVQTAASPVLAQPVFAEPTSTVDETSTKDLDQSGRTHSSTSVSSSTSSESSASSSCILAGERPTWLRYSPVEERAALLQAQALAAGLADEVRTIHGRYKERERAAAGEAEQSLVWRTVRRVSLLVT